MRGVLRFCGGLVALVSAFAFFAAPAVAGSGGSYSVPLFGTPPTIDGAIGSPEWSAATSFPITFGSLTGTGYVGRTSTTLYFALKVNDPTGSAGASAFYFDNNDNGVTEIGDDIKFLNGSATGDNYALDSNFSSLSDTSNGGTNDTTAAATSAAGVYTAEYSTPLCSADTTHDFCFVAPTGATPSKLGFTIAYNGLLAPAQIGNPAGYAEFVIGPDTTPPSAPQLTVTNIEGGSATTAYYSSATNVLWYQASPSASFTLVASGTDPESGIASATFPTVSDLPLGWDTGSHPTSTSFQYYAPTNPPTPPPSGTFNVTLKNGAGLTGPPTTFSFNSDSSQPTGGIDCQPLGCLNTHGPVRVTFSATDNGGSGIAQLRYTLDGTDPGPSNGTPISPGGTISVTSPSTTVKLWGIDNVGNAGQIASAGVSGAAAPVALTWNYANDFQTRSNPGPDLYGNANVWSYGEAPVATAHDSSTYTLYQETSFASGQVCWRSHTLEALTPDDCVVPGTSPPGTDIDPASTRVTVIRWKSPITGTVVVTGGFRDLDTACGDGVNWFVDLTPAGATTTVPGFSGSFGNGGSAPITGSTAHPTILATVSPGDVLTFGVGPGSTTDFFCDSTAADITITQAAPIGGPSVLGNGGFEQALVAGQTGTGIAGGTNAVHVSFGNWQPYRQSTNSAFPGQSTAQVKNGTYSGHILTSQVPGGGNGSELWQDAPQSFDPNQGYILHGFVYPVAGQTQFGLSFDSDRDAGNSAGSAGVVIDTTGTSFGAWGQGASFGALTLNQWHELTLVADPNGYTSTLWVDGAPHQISATGSRIPLNSDFLLPHTSVVLGNACGNCTTANEAYYDDVSLSPLPSSTPSQPGSVTSSTPSAEQVTPGTPVTDHVMVSPDGVAGLPQGGVTFFICGPFTSAQGCPSGGAQVGDTQQLAGDGSGATSNAFTPNAEGFWCFRAAYAGDGTFAPSQDGSPSECFHAASPAQTGPTWTVNTAADHADTSGCTLFDCTLREAILAANAYSDSATIKFAIPTPAPTIQPATPLPAITNSVFLDATTQGGSLVAPPVALDGSTAGGDGLLVEGSGSTVRGFLVEHFGIGIHVLNASHVTIEKNWSGLDATGLVAAGNALHGILVENGDSDRVDQNVTGGNSVHGVQLLNTTNSFVEFNRSGTNATGTAAVPNGYDGVAVDGGSDNRIDGNLTSGNHNQGISLFGVFFPITLRNVVQDNRVGLSADGITPLPNGGDGIRMFNGADNVIGGTGDSQPNTVAYDLGAGVAVYNAASTGNTIRGNTIFGNHGLGIDLGGDGVTANDSLDGDGGANHSQNFPVLASPLVSGTTVDVKGKLVAAPNTRYIVDAYTNSACNASGFGEGGALVGSQNVTTDDRGEAAIAISFTFGGTAPFAVALTATDRSQHETSEFSQCQKTALAGATTAGTVSLTSDVSSAEAGASVIDLAQLRATRDAFSPPAPVPAPIESSPIESSPIESSPIESSPIESSPIESSPIESSPIESSPIESSGFTVSNLQQNGLGGVPLSELPLKQPATGTRTWSSVLGRDVPEQSTTLANALTLNPTLGGLTVGDIDWAHSSSPLASLGVGAFALGPAKLSQIPLGKAATATADWCAKINSLQGFACDSTNAADLAKVGNETVMDIALQGVPIESSGLGAAPIESSNLAGTPIESSPIESSLLQGTPIESSPLSQVDLAISPLGDIPLSAVLAATPASPLGAIKTADIPGGVLSCGNACPVTLAGAAAFVGTKTVRDLGTALSTFTIGDLKAYPNVTFGNIGRGLPSSITIRDLLRALFAHVPFDADSIPLDGIQTIASAGGVVTYSATIKLTSAGIGAGYAELRAAIDPSARYKPGSSSLSLNGVPIPGATRDPGIVDGKLAWSLNGLTYGASYTLSFQVYPGLRLGTDTTQVTLLPVGAPAVSSTPLDVTVKDTFEGVGGNNTPGTATHVLPDKLYLSFEQTQADTDWYSLPVPAAGTVTTITLGHQTNDKDLVVFAPNGAQLRTAPIESSPIESSPIESSPVADPLSTLQQKTDQLQPSAVQDVPIESSQLVNSSVAGVSDNTGTSEDSVTVVSTGAQAGANYLIHVVNSDSTPTTAPYSLHIDEKAPAPPAPCPTTRSFSFTGTTQPSVSPSASPTATTLVLVDYRRYGSQYGTGAESGLKTRLDALTGALVVPVENFAAVQNAYNQWDAQQCSPDAANAVVSAIISNVVDPFRLAHANAKFLVIAGGDHIIPFPRIPDQTTTSNERSYVGTIGFPKDLSNHPIPTNNELVGTAVASYMQSDDVWSAFNPQPFLAAPLYLPQWATGRLVETPDQINHQLDVFNSTGGAINPTTSLVAGYGFLSDSATAVHNALSFAPGPQLDGPWTHANLTTALAASPSILVINAHFDHHRALPGEGNTSDLFDSTEVNAANAQLGRLIFSIGCHSGYSVPNFLYSSPFSLDWPEVDFASGAIARVGNTTYGYGDTAFIGYSEQVEVNFVKRLRQASLGEALMYAKQQYAADLAAMGPFEQKSLNALTFYGLPMQHIGAGTPTPTPTPTPTGTDPVTGLQTVPVTSDVLFGSPFTSPGGGQYFTGPDGADATNNRPLEPKKIVPDITEPGGLLPHGFLITELGVNAPLTGFQAARSRAIPDAANLTPTVQSEVGWPSSLSRISSFASPTGPRQQLVLLHGQFLSDSSSDISGTGTQTNFKHIGGSILYSTSKDAIPPQLSNIHVTRVGSSVAFEADATDATSATDYPPSGAVKEVLVLYYEPSVDATTAKAALLSQTPGTNHWSGAGPLSGTSVDQVSYFMQAVDTAGNVGLSVHKVLASPIIFKQSNRGSLAVTPTGPSAGNGWFGGDTTVSITADPGYALSYSVDGGAVAKYAGSFLVKSDGIHIVDAFSDNGAGDQGRVSIAVPIDTAPPTISILSPVNGSYVLAGSKVKALYSCADAGSGVAVPTTTNGCVGTVPSGTPIDTAVPGTKTFTVTAKDALGHTTAPTDPTATVSYRVWKSVGDSIVALADKTVLFLKGVPLGTTLKARLTDAANAFVAKNTPAVCGVLNLYIAAVKLVPVATLSAAHKDELVADATRIKVFIGCP